MKHLLAAALLAATVAGCGGAEAAPKPHPVTVTRTEPHTPASCLAALDAAAGILHDYNDETLLAFHLAVNVGRASVGTLLAGQVAAATAESKRVGASFELHSAAFTRAAAECRKAVGQ